MQSYQPLSTSEIPTEFKSPSLTSSSDKSLTEEKPMTDAEVANLALSTVKELQPFFQADFEEAEENILVWIRLHNETRVMEY